MKYLIVIVSGFSFGLFSAKACLPARAAETEPGSVYDPVHLKKNAPAPFEGDLVDPDELIDLIVDAECDDETLETVTCMQTLEVLEKKHLEEVKLLEDARLECERRPPLVVEVVKPVPFYERPWFMLTVGVVIGGTVTALAFTAAN